MKVFHIRLSSDLGGIETHILKISTYVDRTKYHFNILMYDNQKPCFYDALSALGGDFFSITSRKKYICRNTKELKIAY
ncbi:MAG: hypothetical protein Q4D76_00600 [Oscillospiraceae bacterium]|nr:hypothetical protein [Oscillospiraceae bacterium]